MLIRNLRQMTSYKN